MHDKAKGKPPFYSIPFSLLRSILTHRLLNSEFILESAVQGRRRRRGVARRGKGSGAGNKSGDGKRLDHGWYGNCIVR